MAGTNEIGSVEGQLVGLPLAGPETFTIQQLAYLKKALGLDETVLWEGNSDNDIMLSESIANFERIGILFSISAAYSQGNDNYGGKWAFFEAGDLVITRKFCVSDNMNDGSNRNTLIFRNKSYNIGSDNRTLTLAGQTQLYYNGTSWSVASRGNNIYKIIGIHRIAGGN